MNIPDAILDTLSAALHAAPDWLRIEGHDVDAAIAWVEAQRVDPSDAPRTLGGAGLTDDELDWMRDEA